ncbi:DUF2207 domain-containing protein [Bacillus sp. A116_S68]|nr:DUF2207 domain-containing protein [Bacillus sp. A116_S68]
MYKFILTYAAVIMIIVGLPTIVKAADYSIEEVVIHAHIQEDGSVYVEETFLYSFTDEFNGIIRTLNPKEGTTIRDFEAFENGTPLTIDTKHDIEHYISRHGHNEKIEIDIHYRIDNGMDFYEDMAEFYWPFFDSTNESTYEDLTIAIYPPDKSANTLAIGYDEGENTEIIQEDGSVIFSMGEVKSGRNGDVRVAFDKGLFPGVSVTKEGFLEKDIRSEQEGRADEAATYAARQQIIKHTAFIALPIIGLIYFIVILNVIKGNHHRKQAVNYLQNNNEIPETDMTMPETIVFYNRYAVTAEVLTASLLDLVRLKKVEQLESNTFRLKDRTDLEEDEKILVSWLFDDIGDGEIFKLADFNAYYTVEDNGTHFEKKQTSWTQAIVNKLKDKKLTVKMGKLRSLLAVSSLLPIGLAIACLMYKLIFPSISAVVISLFILGFTIFYTPKTEKGWYVHLAWDRFYNHLSQMNTQDWKKWPQEKQMKAFVFGLGVHNHSVEKIAKEIQSYLDNINQLPLNGPSSDISNGVVTFMLVGMAINKDFKRTVSANESAGLDSNGNNSIGGGTGVGGGGGGSGAF